MKEKSKKLLKGLGVGALACVGMFGLTGCANISNSDYNRIMNSVETVENSVSSLEAATVYNNAMNKIINTSSDFWNNMKVRTEIVTSRDGDDPVQYCELYMLKYDNENILLMKFNENDGVMDHTEYSVICTSDEKTYSISKEAEYYNKKETTRSFIEESLHSGIISNLFVGMDVGNGFEFFDFSNIVSATKNEQGNYVITTIMRYSYVEGIHSGVYNYVIHNEIDAEYNLISQTIESEVISSEYAYTYTQTNKYTYGSVEYPDIQEEFEQLVNYQVQ